VHRPERPILEHTLVGRGDRVVAYLPNWRVECRGSWLRYWTVTVSEPLELWKEADTSVSTPPSVRL